jgi:hypothetical protein
MSASNYAIAYCLITLIITAFLISIIDKIIYRMYKKKEKPKNTGILCPVTGKELKDFELFNGRCMNCVHHSVEKGKNVTEVCKLLDYCQEDIRHQKAKLK